MLRVDCNVQELNEKQEIEHAQHEQFCFLYCLFHFNPFFLVYLFIYFYLFILFFGGILGKEREKTNHLVFGSWTELFAGSFPTPQNTPRCFTLSSPKDGTPKPQ